MNAGEVLGAALGLLRRRRVLGLGMLVALAGLVYAAVYVVFTLYDPNAFTEIADSLPARLPPALPAWLIGAVLLLIVGGLWSEGTLILTAARQAAGGAAPARPRGAAFGRLPQLLLVAGLVWWPAALLLALAAGPGLYSVLSSQDLSGGWAFALFGSVCCTSLIFLATWVVLWPLQRLANCALLLDGLAPGAAARAARRLFWGRFSSVLGLWSALLVLNVLLILLSALLATAAAALVAGLWGLLDGAPETLALVVTAGGAVLLALLLLLWDGAVSAFNLNTWVLAYRELQASIPVILPTTDGAAQLAGRQRPEGPA